MDLLAAMYVAGPAYGKAYSLGGALSATTRPDQDVDHIRASFEPDRLLRLLQQLHDLASVLPPHAAKTVIHSLTWWRDVIYLRDDSSEGQERRKRLAPDNKPKFGRAAVRTEAPGLRSALKNPKVDRKDAKKDSGGLQSLPEPLERQGELWRVVLTGEKNPIDLFTPENYVAAGKRAIAAGRRLGAASIKAAPGWLGLLLVGLTAALAVGIWVIASTNGTSGGSKLAAGLVAVGTYLTALGRAVLPRLVSAAKKVEQPLWQEALDYLAAEAVSLPPAGEKDPFGWANVEKSRSAQDAPTSTPAG